MASGTYNFTITNGEGVIAAFERIRIRAPSLRQEHMETARRELNLLFVEFSNKQVNLFKVELFSTTLVSGTANYDVAGKVVMILDAWVTTNSGTPQATDLYVTPMSRTEYASLSNKQTPGRPTSYWFNRLIAPVIYPWPVPNASGPYVLNYYACVQMQDANLYGGETPDAPYLWLDAIVAGLAYRLSKTYAPELEQQRKMDAMESWNVAATQNIENVDVMLAPSLGTYFRR